MQTMMQLRSFVLNHFIHVLIYQLSAFTLLFLYLSLQPSSHQGDIFPTRTSFFCLPCPKTLSYMNSVDHLATGNLFTTLLSMSPKEINTNTQRTHRNTAPHPPQMGHLSNNLEMQRKIQDRHPPRALPGYIRR